MIELVPVFLISLYFVPFMVAAGRGHDLLMPILVVNLLLGWTVIGWIGVFFWALLSPVANGIPPVIIMREGALGIPEARRVKNPAAVPGLRRD